MLFSFIRLCGLGLLLLVSFSESQAQRRSNPKPAPTNKLAKAKKKKREACYCSIQLTELDTSKITATLTTTFEGLEDALNDLRRIDNMNHLQEQNQQRALAYFKDPGAERAIALDIGANSRNMHERVSPASYISDHYPYFAHKQNLEIDFQAPQIAKLRFSHTLLADIRFLTKYHIGNRDTLYANQPVALRGATVELTEFNGEWTAKILSLGYYHNSVLNPKRFELKDDVCLRRLHFDTTKVHIFEKDTLKPGSVIPPFWYSQLMPEEKSKDSTITHPPVKVEIGRFSDGSSTADCGYSQVISPSLTLDDSVTLPDSLPQAEGLCLRASIPGRPTAYCLSPEIKYIKSDIKEEKTPQPYYGLLKIESGSEYDQGDTVLISWRVKPCHRYLQVKLIPQGLFRGCGKTIAHNIPNTGQYEFRLRHNHASFKPGRYKIELSSKRAPEYFYTSSGEIKINSAKPEEEEKIPRKARKRQRRYQ